MDAQLLNEGSDIRINLAVSPVVLTEGVMEGGDWDDPSVDMDAQYQEFPGSNPLLLCGWNVDGMIPADLEYLLNFISGWKENGIEDLFYFTQVDHDAAIELIVEIIRGGEDILELGEIRLFERSDGAVLSCRSHWPDATSIDSLVDEVISELLEL